MIDNVPPPRGDAARPVAADNAAASWIPAATGMYAIVAALVVFTGWIANVPRLTDWDANGISMLPNSALCTLLSGLAMVRLALGHRRTPAALGAVVAVVGAATLFEHLTGATTGIDRL